MIGKPTVSLDELMMAVREPELLDTLLDKDPRSVTLERAVEARNRHDHVLRSQGFAEAGAAAEVASRIYSRLGDRAQSLLNHLAYLQMAFLYASTATEYSGVRQVALDCLVEAEQLNDWGLGLEARLIAADSAYWAAMDESSGGHADYLFTAAEDVLGAASAIDNDRSPDDFKFARLVSLIEATADELMARFWFDDADQAKADTLLRRLAVVADRVVPVDFTFPDNAERTAKIAAVLTTLTDRYG